MVKFRFRSNKLPITKVCKHDITCDIKCNLCTKIKTGDEFHYPFIGTYFHAEKIKFIKSYYRNFPSFYKCGQLLSTIYMKEQ